MLLNPEMIQIGYDTTFELNDFSKPRLRGESELVKNLVLTVLFMQPGDLPSHPQLGMDIRRLLYSHFDDIRERDLEEQIIAQCGVLKEYFDNGSIMIRKTKFRGKASLMIHVEVANNPYMRDRKQDLMDEEDERFLIGITFDDLNEMIILVSNGRDG